MVVVPACDACNMKRSGLDEQFKVFLGVTVGYHLDESKKGYRKPVLRTLRHNRKLKTQIQSSMRHIVLRNRSGSLNKPAIAVPLDAASHDIVAERIARGLYFHHTGSIMKHTYPPTVGWLPSIDDELITATNTWATGSVGDDAFVYKYTICADDPDISLWVLQFFQKTWSSIAYFPNEQEVEQDIGQVSSEGAPSDEPSM